MIERNSEPTYVPVPLFEGNGVDDPFTTDELVDDGSFDTSVDFEPGPSVNLAARARAVEELMDGISAQNQLRGAVQSGALSKYSNPREVREGMEYRVERHRANESRAVEALAQTAALRTIGFDDAEAVASRVSVQRELSGLRGTGEQAKQRTKAKRVTQRTAKKALGI